MALNWRIMDLLLLSLLVLCQAIAFCAVYETPDEPPTLGLDFIIIGVLQKHLKIEWEAVVPHMLDETLMASVEGVGIDELKLYKINSINMVSGTRSCYMRQDMRQERLSDNNSLLWKS
ncbi:hypothetical protein ARMSODRAFT_979500 [Armillaria solidipes]|uniref:Uncharacterized protein n=1 Tax=Armillaria solidipes TaxID=1076256 RepID=A0A2H3AZ06_9AGAR|nr:hypothetical protein ARMSODRAFT_979500 [Armillaria solidipes]